jgi:hypothetical protein
MVHLPRLTGFDDDPNSGALFGGNQVVVSGSGR